jgi:DNA-binding response OmpR family regulator
MGHTTTANNARVLVAEDNPALALVVRFHLENAGFRVTVARNGEETWSLLQRDDFDVVVTDQQMPGLSGSEVCARMRREERLADIPVVMLTAKGLEMELDRMRGELGVCQVLPKPFSVRQMVEIVEACTAPSGAK